MTTQPADSESVGKTKWILSICKKLHPDTREPNRNEKYVNTSQKVLAFFIYFISRIRTKRVSVFWSLCCLFLCLLLLLYTCMFLFSVFLSINQMRKDFFFFFFFVLMSLERSMQTQIVNWTRHSRIKIHTGKVYAN